MEIFTWHNCEVPKHLKIKQVYGIIFTKDGRILLKVGEKNNVKKYSFAGGTPEVFDDGMVATLRRELIEEVNLTIEDPIMLGYQEVDEQNGKAPYAQVRMVAMIDKIGKAQPDPDNGKTYERLLIHPNKAIQLLNWGDIGRQIIESAVCISFKKFEIKNNFDKTELV